MQVKFEDLRSVHQKQDLRFAHLQAFCAPMSLQSPNECVLVAAPAYRIYVSVVVTSMLTQCLVAGHLSTA